MPRSLFSEHYRQLMRALADARRDAGLHQTDLAQRLGKPQSFVSKIERAERRIDLLEFLIIVRAIGADASQLIDTLDKNLPADARL